LHEPLFSDVSRFGSAARKKLEKSWASHFYRDVFCKIDEEPFAAFYRKETGAPNFPVNVLIGAEIIKHMFDMTDETLLERAQFDLSVAYALGFRSLDEAGINASTLYDFRHSVYQHVLNNHGKGSVVFKAFENITAILCELNGTDSSRLRMDSTQIMPNIAAAGRLALAFDVLKHAVKASPEGLLSPALARVLEPEYRMELLFKTKFGETASRLETFLNLGNELLFLIKNDSEANSLLEIQLLKRFLKEQSVETKDEKGAVKRKAKNVAEVPAGSLQSAHDSDATFRNKNGEKYKGYVANITETSAKGNSVQFIRHYSVEKNTTQDSKMLEDNAGEIKEIVPDAETMATDGAYASETCVEACKNAGIKLLATDMTGKKPKAGKMPITEFIFNADKTMTGCPAGHKPLRSDNDGKRLSVKFAVECCSKCPYLANCPVKAQKKHYSLYIQLKALEIAEKRAEITENRKENTSERAAVEGTISAVKRAQGLAKLMVRGKNKAEAVTGWKIIGHNVMLHVRGIAKKARAAVKTALQNQLQGVSVPETPELAGITG
jgi:hypothetical protein